MVETPCLVSTLSPYRGLSMCLNVVERRNKGPEDSFLGALILLLCVSASLPNHSRQLHLSVSSHWWLDCSRSVWNTNTQSASRPLLSHLYSIVPINHPAEDSFRIMVNFCNFSKTRSMPETWLADIFLFFLAACKHRSSMVSASIPASRFPTLTSLKRDHNED